MNLRIVLYCAVRRRLITSYTWRTVAGPILQSTARISSSASVGRGSVSAIMYEDITSKYFVCQATFFQHCHPHGTLKMRSPRALCRDEHLRCFTIRGIVGPRAGV